MAEPEVDLLDDLAARVRTGPVMVGNILEPNLASLAGAIIERGTVARPLPRQRPPIACGHPTTAVAFDEAGVEICVACTGEASGLTVRAGERLRIGRVAIEIVEVEAGVAVHYRRGTDPKTYGRTWAGFMAWRRAS